MNVSPSSIKAYKKMSTEIVNLEIMIDADNTSDLKLYSKVKSVG